MKKILFFFIILISLKSFGQFPVNQWLASDSTLVTAKGSFKSRIINKVFTDTAQANTQRVKFYDGSQIITITGGNKFWIRDSTLNKWVQIGEGLFNTSIGSGYKVAVNGTNDVKSIFGSANMVLIDSSSNSNAVTFKIDTSATGIATQHDLTVKITDPMTTLGDIIYRNSTVPTRLPGNTSTVTKGLFQTGTGSVSAAPFWDTAAIVTTTGGTIGDAVIWNGGQNFILGSSGSADSIGVLQFSVSVTDDAPVSGDSTFTVDEFQGKYLEVYRYGELQSEDTIYGVEVDTTTGSWTVHPPYESGEKIIVKAFVYSKFYAVSIPVPPPSWVALDFPTVSVGPALVESPAGVWDDQADGSNGWNSTGLSDVHLAASTNGAIRFKYEAADGDGAIIGFNATNALGTFTDMEAGVYLAAGGDVYKVDGGTPTATGTTISTGSYVSCERTGSTFTVSTSTDGTNWTVRATLTYSSSATHYVNIAVNPDKMYYPMGFNLTL